ncbi:hypothetical protein BT96DRAFT_943346 [Gymnopus androsaceus JB14]|uniref:Uncharacterized protein n=1 Tax=Gymnopus androsaceus JB14 TaxID=1447944 RepID=A0A6A4H7Y0_9AGAR|nr:hypothetical protein BT96DRAFT_943346 [Gymnopus androsaceus JB14]
MGSEAAKKKKAELDVSSEPDNDFIPSINAGTSAQAAGKKKANALLEFNNDENPKYICLELERDFWIFVTLDIQYQADSSGAMRGPGILETFAYHRETTKLSIKKPSISKLFKPTNLATIVLMKRNGSLINSLIWALQ